ncbi:formate/nitrite transporter family protein [Pontiella agarivorans]|uniref:Formate/nitrite transporter family protein n=1 Tax=Pontiella agarivorans TaxID=3038953 RepID=A0ABU5N0K6_9BACT|nr:formate/nitrite transporter family protein [Pontiella agarivorans]MDZ8119980.1 formate/nitrite transporter family protein [Pontiella agarivorans]
MNDDRYDAYIPAAMAKRAEASALRKANRDIISAFFLAVQAGSFIALGGAFYTLAITGSTMGFGMTKLIGGLAFSLGLILVIVAGADLFTGDTLVVMGCLSKKVKISRMLKGWVFVFLGNLVGSLAMLLLFHLSGQWTDHGGVIGAKAVSIANYKVSHTFTAAFVSGMLCNILVCLAIWLCYSSRSVTDKILSIIFPITAFVAMGFEHSIANMYLIPAGLILKSNPDIVSQLHGADLSNLTLQGFLLNNLLPVTVGNMVGGALFVGTIYWILYLRKQEN